MSYLIVKREALKVDGWTYGDWRQYVAFLDDDTAICCRISSLPATFAIIGFLALAMAGCGVAVALTLHIPVFWSRVLITLLVGIALLSPWLLLSFTPWRLVVPVGKRMKPREDGSYWRADF